MESSEASAQQGVMCLPLRGRCCAIWCFHVPCSPHQLQAWCVKHSWAGVQPPLREGAMAAKRTMAMEQPAPLTWCGNNSRGYSGRKSDLDHLSPSFHSRTAHWGREAQKLKASGRRRLGDIEPDPPPRSMSSRSPYRSSEDHVCPTSKPAFGPRWPVSQYEPVAATVMVSNVGQQKGTLTRFPLPSPQPSSPEQRGREPLRTRPHHLPRLQTVSPSSPCCSSQ